MINLLPEAEKDALLREERWKIASILGLLLFIFLILVGVVLFGIGMNLKAEVESQKAIVSLQENRLKSEDVSALKRKISSLNEKYLRLDSFYQKQRQLTEIMDELSGILPAGMYLTNLSFQKANSQITLSGFSLTREALVGFKKNLEQQDNFKEVTFPTSNWVRAKNINFYVSFKLK